MRIVFVGASKFGLRCLKTCLNMAEVVVVGVVTAPQKFSISYRPNGVTNVLHAGIGEFASSRDIPVELLEQSMSDPTLFDTVSRWKPDVFVVVGWYHMVPKRWRELAPSYGLHASLLPDYSGGAPLVWAMINGESETGITLFQMDSGVDSGPIVGQKAEPIRQDDTIATLYERIEVRGVELIEQYLPLLASGSVQLKNQDDSKRRVMPQRAPEDGLINWNENATQINRFIRAQTHPYPGAFTLLNGKKLHIWQADVVEVFSQREDIGRICHNVDGSYLIGCGEHKIAPKVIGYEGISYEQGQFGQLFQRGGQIFGCSQAS